MENKKPVENKYQTTEMKIRGLTITMVFEANSANYGESVGNVSSLKKVTRNSGEQYTYISRQALRYNIVEQLNYDLAGVVAAGNPGKKVIQFDRASSIENYPELDFFGYMKTGSKKSGNETETRSAKVRLSHAISMDTFKGDLDFLTNKGLADRIKENMNISQSEIHYSYYRYSITADLDQIGIDNLSGTEITNEEKSKRVQRLLDTISMLYRDIRGRREDLKPLFAIGGVYTIKNPFFQNLVEVKDNRINATAIKNSIPKHIEEDNICGLVEGKFLNDKEIKEELDAVPMPEFFERLKAKVREYYESC